MPSARSRREATAYALACIGRFPSLDLHDPQVTAKFAGCMVDRRSMDGPTVRAPFATGRN